MTPMESRAPQTTVGGKRIRAGAISSTIPEPILPHGSIPSVEKIYTDEDVRISVEK